MPDKSRKSRPKSAGKSNSRRKPAGKTKSTGPRLPSALRKELDNFRNPNLDNNSDEDDIIGLNDEEINSDEDHIEKDFYEYEEVLAEEETSRNRRYDPVENVDYQLPENFKDEDIPSDDDVDGIGDGDDGEQDKDSDDDERHARMLYNITGIPAEAFEGQKRKRKPLVSEAYPESEFNPTHDAITIEDLLDGLSKNRGVAKLKKQIQRGEKIGTKVLTPLPTPVQEKLDRKVAYDNTKNDITKWEQQIRGNREARTLVFDIKNETRAPTVGTIATEFKPRTDYEKTIASLMHDDDIMDAYRNDGIKLLEMNKVSVEDVKDRQDKLAKMRSVLFAHEMKAKHIKKIKSKTYHRLKNKDKMKASGLDSQTDPEAAREVAEKQERERIEARMTLRRKNQGKWARRILERGLDKQDEGTRAAISEQLHLHTLLTRKMNSMKEGSNEDDSTDEDDGDFDSSDEEGASKLLARAKEKTLRLMEQADEVPESGVLSLPFMVRGLEKRKEAASEEAKRALEDYELSLNQQDENTGKGQKHGTLSGKRVFGATQKKVEEPSKRHRPEVDNYGSENEDIIEENDGHLAVEGNYLHKDVDINLDVLREDLEIVQESAFESVDDITVEDPGSRKSYDVSVFAGGSWKKMQNSKNQTNTSLEGNPKHILRAVKPSRRNGVGEEMDEDSDSDGGQMVDGMLSSGAKQTYELPSNDELIKRAFAGDDVDEEFHKAKEEVLNEENPEPEKPLLLPGWGQWSSVQKKRGVPTWMSKEHANAKQKRDEALKKRKDARLKDVIISEKVDKKAEKLYHKALPYPYTLEEVFHQAGRMPLGPEFNPATVAGTLTRPEVVKKSGQIIPPISFKEVNPHEKGAYDTKQGKKRRNQNGKNSGKKPKLTGK